MTSTREDIKYPSNKKASRPVKDREANLFTPVRLINLTYNYWQ